jgi:hypothetical protein
MDCFRKTLLVNIWGKIERNAHMCVYMCVIILLTITFNNINTHVCATDVRRIVERMSIAAGSGFSATAMGYFFKEYPADQLHRRSLLCEYNAAEHDGYCDGYGAFFICLLLVHASDHCCCKVYFVFCFFAYNMKLWL